jgi:signal transduction histidine kinase
VAGVFAWLQVLAREAGRAAEEESRRQTQLLLTEIDAHRRTDAKLARARAVAEAANLAKTRFIVSVSHELRTPLNAVLGYAQLLEHDEAIPPHRREAMRIIRRGGEHMQGLIEGLMDISKIEAGRIEIERREVRLMDFLSQIAGMFRLQAAAKGLDFRFDYPARLPACVFTDEIRLRQILINLLSNALKFTEAGHICFTLRVPGEVMEFEVSDTGPGIAAANMQRIFEPFERVAPPPGMAPVQGIGLGLTITKLLLEILGGHISVDSTPGTGSRFKVQLRLPEAAQPRPAAAVPSHITGYEGPRRTIIAAEDNPLHRALLHDALTPAGFSLLTAPDGASCLRLAEAQNADLFLLDISMPSDSAPEYDGLTLARHLRESRHAATPIVILSAHAPELRPGPAAPYDAVLTKPVDITLLFETIGRLLRLRWYTEADPAPAAPIEPLSGRAALRPHIAQLRYLAGIGFIRGLQECLTRVATEDPAAAALSITLQSLVESLRLPEFLRALEEIADDAA